MRNLYDPTLDPAGYDDCVLGSSDDYEPYGYAPPQLQPVTLESRSRGPDFDRVIEAQLLAHSSMVGC